MDDEYVPLDHEEAVSFLNEEAARVSQHSGQGIALAGRQIVAVAATLHEACALARERGYPEPVFVAVPPRDAHFR